MRTKPDRTFGWPTYDLDEVMVEKAKMTAHISELPATLNLLTSRVVELMLVNQCVLVYASEVCELQADPVVRHSNWTQNSCHCVSSALKGEGRGAQDGSY